METKQSLIDHLLSLYQTPDGVVANLKRQIETKPVDARLDLQVFLNAMGREEESFALSNDLIRLAPRDSRVLFNRGWHMMKRGRLREGLELAEHGRRLNAYGQAPLQSSRPVWQPHFGRGHRVHLVLEGGLGDEVIHFRFVRDLTERFDCRVTVICQPQLAEFFSHQENVAALAQREAALGIYHDSWLPGMSAALLLEHEYPTLSGKPYLRPHPERMRKWGSFFAGEKLKVGIRWAGNPRFEHQQLRRSPEDLLFDLRHRSGVQFYSFQRDDGLVPLPEEILDLGPRLRDWDDTAAALSHMDLVITSCTSVAHVSAALGRRTWVIVPALPYFIWSVPGETSPWYDSVRLFRQQSFGDWRPVRESLHREFDRWARTIGG